MIKRFELRARKEDQKGGPERRAGLCQKNKRIKQKMVHMVIFEVFMDTDRCHKIHVLLKVSVTDVPAFDLKAFCILG